MTNPWLELRREAPYILPMDKRQIQEHDSRRHESSKLALHSIPEPFIGNPETAKVVLLLLNPGHEPTESEAHRHPELKEALFRNLRGEPQRCPFFPLNPSLSWSPTAKWWIPRTHDLREATGLDCQAMSERLLAIEWFPYHSINSGLPTTPLCESQKYTFELAKTMLSTNKFVVRMRSEKHWSKVDPRFLGIPSLKNPRCGYVSRRNTEGDTFDRMVEALTAN